MNRHTYTITYRVNLPERRTPEYESIVRAFLKDEPEYVEDPENMEPDVLEDNLVVFATEKYHVGDWTDIVDVISDRVD
jgi:hypothetical protein